MWDHLERREKKLRYTPYPLSFFIFISAFVTNNSWTDHFLLFVERSQFDHISEVQTVSSFDYAVCIYNTLTCANISFYVTYNNYYLRLFVFFFLHLILQFNISFDCIIRLYIYALRAITRSNNSNLLYCQYYNIWGLWMDNYQVSLNKNVLIIVRY